MKKLFINLLVFFLLCGVIFFPITAKAETKVLTRVINVVYDDSGSMIYTNDRKVDTWCQAKYAMEVFASMLGDQDTMNIYVMSDFCNSSNAAPLLTLKGAEGSAANVEKVHNMITNANNTPFDAVRKAYSDLAAENADDKWLVVLTDGEFQNVEDVDAFFANKQQDVKVLFLGMGPDADAIRTDNSRNIYAEKAENNSQILNKITDICRHIFSSDKLSVNINNLEFSFDVPMKELVVFAQGRNVEIKGIVGSDGTLIESTDPPVAVKYSEKATTNSNANYDNPLVAKELGGSIAVFSGDFATGTYKVDVKGAETIEVYYKPNVELEAYLVDVNGTQIKNGDALNEGKYTLGFGFVKAGTEEKVPDSYLLGIVSYAATITNNGRTEERSYSTGYDVEIKEGDFHADVTTNYLSFNTISTSLDFKVLKETGLELKVLDNPEYILKDSNFTNGDRPIRVQAMLNGQELTQEQWNLIDEFNAKFTGENKKNLGALRIEKSEETGIFNVYPNMGTDKPTMGEYKDEPILVSCNSTKGGDIWKGEVKTSLNIYDSRGTMQKNPASLIKYVVIVVIAIAVVVFVVIKRKRDRY